MKTKLLALLLFMYCQCTFAQAINPNNLAIVRLQHKYNEAISIALNTDKLPWNSAVVIADASVNLF